MKKKWSMILGIICYAIGVFSSIYVGGWLMLIQPIHTLIISYNDKSLSFSMLIMCIVKIALSSTFAGFVWCIGYIGYNHFQGTEDPDWEAIEKRWKERKAKKGEKK